MKENNGNNIFIKSLSGTIPIKNTNKVKRPIPKQKTISQNKINLEKTETKNISTKETRPTPIKEFRVEKNTMNKRLKKGKIQINKKIDFHGCSLEEAKQLFINTINDCFIDNKRCILFVTGKGIAKNKSDGSELGRLYFGKIRNSFLTWAAINEVKSKILNIQQANIENGGDGAFFVYLRKNRN